MHWNDRFRPRRDRGFHSVRGEALRGSIHVHEDRPRADMDDNVRRRAEGQRGHDHLVARSNAQREEGEMQGRGA